MEKVKKYRLGNQPEEYELVTRYLGWFPKGHTDWEAWLKKDRFKSVRQRARPEMLTLVSPDKKEKVDLMMHYGISRDTFPLSFLCEGRADGWLSFYIVATKAEPTEQFIIPLH